MSFYPKSARLDNGIITVDQALNTPTLIEERIAEVASKNLLVDTIFSTDSTPVEGGAVIYSKTTEKNFYTDNDITPRMPGDEYTVVYRQRPEAQLARVEDYGGKFATSDEARRRNQNVDFDNDVTALANTITRKLNRRAIETLEAAFTGNEAITLTVGTPWSEIALDGDPTKITQPGARPHAAMADVIALADQKDLGINYTKMLVSPMTRADLRIAYGRDLTPMLEDLGIELLVSNYVDPGNAYMVDPQKVGFVKYEEPLTVTTWRDEAHRKTWTQAYAMPVMGITLPAAVARIEGIKAGA